MTASDRYIKIAAILGLRSRYSYSSWPRNNLRQYLRKHGLTVAHCRTYYSIHKHIGSTSNSLSTNYIGDIDCQGAYRHQLRGRSIHHTTNLLQAMTQNLA